jgi:protein-S-isoprenylcysteine O-methyltransferase Ste14
MSISTNKTNRLDRSGLVRIITVLGMLVFFGAILFSLAGRLDWWEAWIFLAIYLCGIGANGLWSLTHNPEVINERGRIGKNAKSWDKLIGVIYTVFLVATFALAGIDARFSWSVVPQWAEVLGALGFIVSLAIVFWAMTANTFLSAFVRIQDERGHTTVTGGPYRFVRHPMYVGILFMSWGMPLLLGSWWAVIPGVLNILLFIVRTSLEDRTLQAELPGYMVYTKQVRYRLVPGVW